MQVFARIVMEKQTSAPARRSVQTTVGELVEAITQIALEAGKSEREGYRLASRTIESLMRAQKAKAHVN